MNRAVGNREVASASSSRAVAWNDAVVAAFQASIGRPVIVPPHHDVTGAIGAALLARDEMEQQRRAGNNAQTRFRGFDLRSRYYTTKSFICRACPNLCEINRVEIGDEPPIFYGARCELYEAGRREPAPETGRRLTSPNAWRCSWATTVLPANASRDVCAGLPHAPLL